MEIVSCCSISLIVIRYALGSRRCTNTTVPNSKFRTLDPSTQNLAPTVKALDAVGMTVSYTDRSAETISSNQLGFRKAITVRDPDGHVMQIVEQ